MHLLKKLEAPGSTDTGQSFQQWSQRMIRFGRVQTQLRQKVSDIWYEVKVNSNHQTIQIHEL